MSDDIFPWEPGWEFRPAIDIVLAVAVVEKGDWGQVKFLVAPPVRSERTALSVPSVPLKKGQQPADAAECLFREALGFSPMPWLKGSFGEVGFRVDGDRASVIYKVILPEPVSPLLNFRWVSHSAIPNPSPSLNILITAFIGSPP